MDSFVEVIIMFCALILSLVVHEYTHGLVAYFLGDDTARRAGRLTLNPLPHLDMVGTVVLPLLAIVSGFPIIGWAKPVPYNPYNLKDQKWGPVYVAIAGPLSNFAGAAIYLTALKYLIGSLGQSNLLIVFLIQLAIVNIVLGIFNLLPVPPLDGSKILSALFDSPKHRSTLLWLETRGPNLLMAIVLLDWLLPISILGGIFYGAINYSFRLFGLA